METKSFPIEIKTLEPSGVFTGYASTFGNIDYDGDVVVKGAFKRTIQASKGIIPILYQHDTKQPIGIGMEMSEDDHGLLVKGQLVMEVARATETHALMKAGALKGLSIGYQVPTDGYSYKEGVRYLKEIKLMEYSPVTFPANDQAQVNGVKSAISFQNLALADEATAWDQAAARKALDTWALGDDPDWTKYRRAFLWADESAPEDRASYKYQIGTIVDGKLMAVPAALAAVVDTVKASTRGEEQAKLRAHLDRYYQKAGKESPFVKMTQHPKGFKADDFYTSLAEAGQMQALYDQRWNMESALSESIDDIRTDETLALEDKKAAITTSLIQYAGAMAAWWGRYMDMMGEDGKADPAIVAEKKALTEAACKSLMEAMGHSMKALDAHREGIKALRRSHNRMQSLLEGSMAPAADDKAANTTNDADAAELRTLIEASKQFRQQLSVI